MDNGFAQLRRGIKEHIQSRRIYLLDFSTYTLLLIDASPESGIVWMNAAKLAKLYECELGGNRGWFRKSLERLESGLYIKRFPKPGSPKPYPILINKFLCSLGARSGMYLDAINTRDWRKPLYVPGAVEAQSRRGRGAVEPVSYRDLKLDTREEPRAQNQRALPPVDNSVEKQENQRRKIEARDNRLAREVVVYSETQIGAGPEVYHAPPIDVRAAVKALAERKKL
jgi:hypothetical protein